MCSSTLLSLVLIPYFRGGGGGGGGCSAKPEPETRHSNSMLIGILSSVCQYPPFRGGWRSLGNIQCWEDEEW